MVALNQTSQPAERPIERTNGKHGRRGLPPAIVDRMYRDYQRLKSLSKTGKLWGRTRQAMWEILKTKKLQLCTRRFREKVTYRGETYTVGKDYLRRTSGDRAPLHHVIWIEANGPIPEGHNIRFLDGDRFNCSLDNLHCAPIEVISSHTATGENQTTKRQSAELVMELDPVFRGMAFKIAGRHYQLTIDAQDLVAAARVQALSALRKFRRQKSEGSPRAYAITSGKYAMLNWIRTHGRDVRVPANKFYSHGHFEQSIQAPLGNDEDSGTFEEVLLGADETTTSTAATGERNALLAKIIKRLPPRDRKILAAYYFEERTLENIGVEHGITKEAVRQRLVLCLATLKRSRTLKSLRREGSIE